MENTQKNMSSLNVNIKINVDKFHTSSLLHYLWDTAEYVVEQTIL
jgi:hypothetical protein